MVKWGMYMREWEIVWKPSFVFGKPKNFQPMIAGFCTILEKFENFGRNSAGNFNLEQEIEISQFKGWGDLELAWCYALIDEKEKAEEYLNNVEEYLSSQFQTDVQLQADYQEV